MRLKKGFYRHYKGGEYEVLDLVRHSETEQEMVLYRPCYGEGALWVRPLEMFQESVEIDGEVIPRFQHIGEAPDTRS
jgi:hypothetical protein